eukprot:1190278-Prorocentrum_minimum.AAC.3
MVDHTNAAAFGTGSPMSGCGGGQEGVRRGSMGSHRKNDTSSSVKVANLGSRTGAVPALTALSCAEQRR